jgi:heme/copper-type cytochrome/quinol oxidase subunit 2
MTRTTLVLVAAAALVAGASYFWFRPQSPPPVGEPVALPAPEGALAVVSPALGADFAFEVAAGKITGPPALLAREGEQVTLRVRSDVADELHVHGYDLSAPLPAGEEVALRFIASRAGRFEVELHKAHRELGALEVQPR